MSGRNKQTDQILHPYEYALTEELDLMEWYGTNRRIDLIQYAEKSFGLDTKKVKTYGENRKCACGARLSRYNPDKVCRQQMLHESIYNESVRNASERERNRRNKANVVKRAIDSMTSEQLSAIMLP